MEFLRIKILTDGTSGTRTRATHIYFQTCRNMFDALNHCATAASYSLATFKCDYRKTLFEAVLFRHDDIKDIGDITHQEDILHILQR